MAELQQKIERYGWRPSLPDPRNLVADVSLLPIYAERDPRSEMEKCYDQLQLGSCTANAFAGAQEYNDILDGDHRGTPSRLDIYYGERYYEGTLGQGDTGAYGHDAFKWARYHGTLPETDWPYDISRFEDKPPADSPDRRKIGYYKHPYQSEITFKRVLCNRQTIAFGFTVFESFESAEVASTGIVPMPDLQNEQVLGGHEVLMVGYLKDEPAHALVRNSWGTGWGIDGYFLMPWSYILDPNLCSDFRTLYRPAGA